MKYIALLRGINVGGNSIIKMADLKKAFESWGYANVETYIQSGNVIFEKDGNHDGGIAQNLERRLSQQFHYRSTVVVLTSAEFVRVVKQAPPDWRTRTDLRCYIAFVKKPVSAGEVATAVRLKEGIDFMKVGDDALYMSTLLSGITKSGFTKLVGSKIYKDITIRNFTTVKKILGMLG